MALDLDSNMRTPFELTVWPKNSISSKPAHVVDGLSISESVLKVAKTVFKFSKCSVKLPELIKMSSI